MITRKDISKMMALMIVSATMAFVCSVFLNYLLDIEAIKHMITDPDLLRELDSRMTMAQMTIIVTFGTLGITTIFLIISAVGSYIHEAQSTMGILKALGYSNMKIAIDFYKFGVAVLLGVSFGYILSMLISPIVYQSFSENGLVNITLTFQIRVMIYMVVIPFLLTTIVAVSTAWIKLRKKPLEMINDISSIKVSKKLSRYQAKSYNENYLKEVSQVSLRSNLKVVGLVIFAAFCFSAMLQMPITLWGSGFSTIGAVIMVVSAITLGCGILYIVLSIVIKHNQKAIAIMKMCGYSNQECHEIFLKKYQYYGYAGFVIGTIYQYVFVHFIMKMYQDSEPNFHFDVEFKIIGLLIVMALYYIYYQGLIFVFKKKM